MVGVEEDEADVVGGEDEGAVGVGYLGCGGGGGDVDGEGELVAIKINDEAVEGFLAVESKVKDFAFTEEGPGSGFGGSGVIALVSGFVGGWVNFFWGRRGGGVVRMHGGALCCGGE